MRYLSVAEIAKKWDVSERSVRNYCAQGRVMVRFLPERLGTFRKMQKSRSALTKEKKNRLLCWISCKIRRQVNTPAGSITKHRLI